MEAEGHDPPVFEAVRIDRRQWWIYGKRRTVKECVAAGVAAAWAWAMGKRASSASSHLVSVHGHGLAVDIISKSKMWDATPEFWESLGRAAKRDGLTWGGGWKSPVDPPHI